MTVGRTFDFFCKLLRQGTGMRKRNGKTLGWIVALILIDLLSNHYSRRAGAAEAPGLIDGARKEASLMIYSLLITRVVILSLASMSPGASAAPARRE